MGYLHLDSCFSQSPKRAAAPCGDVFVCSREPQATTAILCDGIGSGVKAHLAAEMTVARLTERLAGGASAQKAFATVVRDMERARRRQDVYPWAAMNLVRLGPDGACTILTYEAPPAILLAGPGASILHGRTLEVAPGASEADVILRPGDRLVLCSDGITQAGLGQDLRDGWRIEGVRQLVAGRQGRLDDPAELAQAIHDRARQLWKPPAGDDCTAAVLQVRKGVVVNLLTGPPSLPDKDASVVRDFLATDGIKVVCGATTSSIVARRTGRDVVVDTGHHSVLAPPKYALEGIDLVTEGAVTLNQACNILQADPDQWTDDSGVTELCHLLRAADRVNITVGRAANPANETIHFQQQGILRRGEIVDLLAAKLRRMGKLVVLRNV